MLTKDERAALVVTLRNVGRFFATPELDHEYGVPLRQAADEIELLEQRIQHALELASYMPDTVAGLQAQVSDIAAALRVALEGEDG